MAPQRQTCAGKSAVMRYCRESLRIIIVRFLRHKDRNFFGEIQKRSDGNSIFIFLLLCDLAAASRASWVVYCS